MPCYHPMKAWRSADPSDYNPETGKFRMTFNSAKGLPSTEVELPCGKCIGCLSDRARTWAVRCMHEASLHKENCFITLTYNKEHYPENGSLNRRDFQLFMKRLRKKYDGRTIRFYHAAEYGADFSRPHHHACLFGIDFSDKYAWSIRDDIVLYRSDILESLWSYGYSSIGDVTYDTASYVAKYILKKQFGERADDYYKGLLPEFQTMSRRPGLGRGWYEKYKDDLYNYDKCVVNDKLILKSPRYYDNLYDIDNSEHLLELKQERIKKAKEKPDNTFERLKVRERVHKLKLDRHKRKLENPLD